MSIIFILGAMAAGFILLQIEFILILLMDIASQHTPLVLSVFIYLIMMISLVIVILSQLKAHLRIWGSILLKSTSPTNPDLQSDIFSGIKWMIKEQASCAWYILNLGKIKKS